MHAEIMEFPNQQFYQEQLTILPEEIEVSELQQSPLNYMPPEPSNWMDQLLCRKRVLFLPTPIDEGGEAHKTNRHEAKLIRDLTQSFIRIYHENNLELNGSSIGIITPYRAQIAQIKKALKEENLPVEKITIDTVERYQGGSRDIILVSLCTNKLGQLASLVNKSEEGDDRKLNVALTRARHNLVLVGNPDILKRDEVYGEFMKRYGAGTP
jgi:DNA replication ATP-dependent helicase Dna2